MDYDALQPDANRLSADIESLSQFTSSEAPGCTRRSYGEPYRASREWVRKTMVAAGLDVVQDASGNVIGRLRGTSAEGNPVLMTGSHTDTVHGGGRFDGVVGVLGAIEAARRLRETNTSLTHDLWVVDFIAEEISEFGTGCVGSQAFIGKFPNNYPGMTTEQGVTLANAMYDFGIDPNDVMSMTPTTRVGAFVELHIEQGPVLERKGLDIGVVTAIAGIELLTATFSGRADHAGTTPMSDRHDALAAAAAAVIKIEQMGCSGEDSVATAGQFESNSGGTNVISSAATLRAEMRSGSAEWIGMARAKLCQDIEDEAHRRGVDVELAWTTDEHPTSTTPMVHDLIAETSHSLGYSWTAIPSGAGHDAAFMEEIAPMGMIFVPSRDGRSHCPEEWTDVDGIGKGVHTLAATLVRLDSAALA